MLAWISKRIHKIDYWRFIPIIQAVADVTTTIATLHIIMLKSVWACRFPSEYTYCSSAYIDSIIEQQSLKYDVNKLKRDGRLEWINSDFIIQSNKFYISNKYSNNYGSFNTFLFFLPNINSSNKVIYIIDFLVICICLCVYMHGEMRERDNMRW